MSEHNVELTLSQSVAAAKKFPTTVKTALGQRFPWGNCLTFRLAMAEHLEDGVVLSGKANLPYKFKELKVYASTEWLADNKKKYRQVFDRYEISYVYAELSFFNKLFDEEDWDITITLKCFSVAQGKRKELCKLDLNKKVSKYDSTVYIREGWGNKNEGTFWKKGTYYWEAYIEGQKEATKYFYVEDAGEPITDENNPYLELRSLRLYEGPYDDMAEEDRTYYKTFSAEETRYIYGEFTFKNGNVGQKWQCELFSKFYNGAKELKGQVIRLQSVKKDEDFLTITAGWGSNHQGSWRLGNYTLELVFMDRLMAVIPFAVEGEFREGFPHVRLPHARLPMVMAPDEDPDETLDSTLSKLDQLIGLQRIKKTGARSCAVHQVFASAP